MFWHRNEWVCRVSQVKKDRMTVMGNSKINLRETNLQIEV
jgi:hypothetical protein